MLFIICTNLLNIYVYFPVSISEAPLVGRRNSESQNSEVLEICRKFLALESAHQCMIGLTIVAIFVPFLRKRRDIVPQASELSATGPEEGVPAESSRAQNVQFADAHPGFVDDRGWTNSDPLRDSTLMKDASLEDFFSRPIKITELEWKVGTGTPLHLTFNPWELYFGNKRVINRITNFRLMKANLRVKFMLNGNSFYFGRLLASYRPLHLLDTTTLFRPGIRADFVEASQRPHVYMNPTESQGGELFLPFFTPLNMLDIPAQGWNEMGEITIAALQPLKHANGATQAVTVSVFAWAENVDLSVLTQTNPGSVVPQAKEEWKGIISKPASNIAKIAGTLSKVPGISNFALASEIGARSIAQMAALFGFSKPAAPDTCPFQPMTRQSMADTDGKENLVRLVVDTKNELSIDPAIVGIDAKDELVIHEMVSRESFLTSFDWKVGTAVEQLLFNIVIDPCVHRQNGGGNNPELHMPAMCYATMPFEYWKGSLKYRFQIVCSGYHKGRLKFVYDPVSTPQNGIAEYNTAYTQIVDVAENNDFAIEVGWGQSTPWRRHVGISYNDGPPYGDTPLAYNSISSQYGNGTLSVYIVNELTVPSDVEDNDVQINVFLSACDDYEVAAPTDYYLAQLAFRPPGFTPRDRSSIQPQSEDIDDVPIAGPPTLNHMGPRCPTDSLINKIHMGETIVSFRTLLKRYNLHEVMVTDAIPPVEDGVIAAFTRTMFPHSPGYTTFTNADNNLISDTFSGGYVFAKMTLLNYLQPAFGAWRGAIRYTTDATYNVVTSETTPSQVGDSTWSVSRITTIEDSLGDSIPNDATLFPDTSTKANLKYDLLSANIESNGITGVTRWNTKVNPVQSYEIPFYSKYRFAPGRQKTRWTEVDQYQSSYRLLGSCVSSTYPNQLFQYVAAGEDFTLMFYLSPPVFYEDFLLPP